MKHMFLFLQSKLEKKTTRQKSMSNRLRLGQFVTQRQGATFVENWNDGWAFTDLLKYDSLNISPNFAFIYIMVPLPRQTYPNFSCLQDIACLFLFEYILELKNKLVFQKPWLV